jgi:NAD(P)H-hydrate epimerase
MLLPLPETDEATLNFGAYKNIRAFIREVDILVIGPGLSQNQQTRALVRKVIKDTAKPMIIDADGLNALSGNLGILNAKYKIILTPHPGEMARLMGKTIEVIQKKRKEFAKQFAQYYKLTVVLKGHNTVVADYKDNLYINKTGNPGMATAGSGDVLTGMIASFLGQGLEEFLAAKYAVYLHGLAGDLSAKKKTQLSLIASDIINAIPEAIRISSY